MVVVQLQLVSGTFEVLGVAEAQLYNTRSHSELPNLDSQLAWEPGEVVEFLHVEEPLMARMR